MFETIEPALLHLANNLPLPLFAFLASFIEEVIAPLPSLSVLFVTGSFAALQHNTLTDLFLLAFLAALGKLLGAIVLYFLADKIGDRLIDTFGRFFDITHESVRHLQEKITDTPRDYLLLTILRALPVFPSAIISLGSGLLEIPLRIFIITTLVGTIVRDSIVIYIGYIGTSALRDIAINSSYIESFIQITVVGGTILLLAYLFWRHRQKKLG